MFSKVLVANRGEIAVRVMRTCKRLGIKTVAIYSDADLGALHTKLADEAIRVGEAPPLQSYLSIDNISEAIKKSGADAVHPGYGFLSEFHQFAEAVEAAGAVWIGPDPEVMKRVESKTYSRRVARDQGIPTIPGAYEPITDPAVLERLIGEFGPMLIKPDAGGGGKGTRKFTDPKAAKELLEGASREAKLYFGNGDVYAEKLLERPRHIEVQILADRAGKVVHLFERECSLQRRFQKIVEETPSPALTPEKRDELLHIALEMARATGYTNAGTFEFLYDESSGQFYFLEINKRLQVEHPVTEMTTGVDIVEQQLKVSADEEAIDQEAVRKAGHSIEARIYAEDPRTFMPSPGKISGVTIPQGEHVRVDHALEVGTNVSFYYDPLIAKLIVWGSSRGDAIERMQGSLREFKVEGVKTSIPLHEVIFSSRDFQDGRFDVTYLDSHLASMQSQIKV